MIPTTIFDDIERQSRNEHRTYTELLTMRYNDNSAQIQMPTEPTISKYKELVDKYTITKEISEEAINMYRYSPKKLSEDLYGTTGYWSVLLFINDCCSILDFGLTDGVLKYVDPDCISELFDEITVLERMEV